MSARATILAVMLFVGAACAADVPETNERAQEDDAQDVDEPSDALALERPVAPSGRPAPAGYYVGRQDLRRCAFPTCGGYWVRLANRTSQRCLDGRVAEECYVALLDTDALGGVALSEFGSGRVVVEGALAAGDAGERGPYALLRVASAFRAEGEAPLGEPLSFVHDAGVRCVRAPCPAPVTAQRLNASLVRTLTLDLSATGASDEVLARAREALLGSGLVVAGHTTGGRVPTLRASQLLLPVARPTPPAQCERDDQCGLGFHREPIASAADCTCPTCPAPLLASAAAANDASWQALCAPTHGPDVCPPAPCAPPPPVVCRMGTCMYGDPEL